MQRNVNLLPEDLIKITPLVQLGNYVRVGVILSFVIFFVVIGVFGALFILNSRDISANANKVKELEEHVIALQTTEQRLFLLNDRLAKAKSIYESKTASSYLDKFYALFGSYKDEISLSNLAIDRNNVNFGFGAETSLEVADLLTGVLSSGLFKDIDLNTFDFSKNSNFSIELTLKD